MSISRTSLGSLLLCLACLLLVVGATAAEKPKAVEDLEALKKLVVQKKWKDAVEGFGRLFDEHPGDPELVRRVRDIEDDFKRALFMLDYGKPSGKDLFGPQVKYWGLSSLKVELVCGSTLSGPAWTRLKGGARLLDIRFRDKVTVKMDSGTTGRMLLCYDLEKEGGYLVQLPGFVVRLDSAGEEVIGRPNQRALRKARGAFKISRDSHSIKVHKGGVQITRASDKTYKGGYLAFLGRFQGLVIEGRLDEDFYLQLAGSREDKAFREWQEKSYNREEALPEWLRKGVPTSTGPSLAELPSDATKGLAEDLGEHLEKALEGEEKSAKALKRFARSQFGEKARTYLEAVAAIGDGEIREGEEKLTKVLEKEPGFGPALALRGLVRISLRRLDEARADLAAARKASPTLHWTYIGLVRIAIYEGDLGAASRAVVESQKAGAHTPDMERLGKLVHRARRGPLWGTRHHYSSKNFEISSDHSKDLCKDAARLLETALTAYARHFSKVEMPERKARVYVFGSRQSYLGYGKDLRRDLAYSSGAYDPSLRELVFFLPVNRKHFNQTVRHEGFHRFLHVFLDDCPIWFNEGCAEYFGCSKEVFGTIKPGAVDEDAVKVLKALIAQLTPLDKLFTMSHREFMTKAHLHYPQAWAVVHFLLNTKDSALDGLLMDYFESLREGRSAKEAYEEHLEPKLRKIEGGYRRHFGSL